jgi:hypothetical protein
MQDLLLRGYARCGIAERAASGGGGSIPVEIPV